MAISFVNFAKEDLIKRVRLRDGETKVGQVISVYPNENTRYEIIGIPESIGVRANYGIGGTETAWENFLSVFLNTQSNRYISSEELCVLGNFIFPEYKNNSVEELRKIVEEIDERVADKIQEIVLRGHIPIVIGGGHNNSYGNIKGTSAALKRPISVVNIDAHADFRKLEGRHSGNGFSYAFSEGYMEHYTVFGLQKSYISAYMLDKIEQHSQISAYFFDEIITENIGQKIREALSFSQNQPLGVEVDLDVIENVLSSAVSPVGFSMQQMLQLINIIKEYPKIAYLHLTEGAAILDDGRTYGLIGKVLTELVLAFIRR